MSDFLCPGFLFLFFLGAVLRMGKEGREREGRKERRKKSGRLGVYKS